VTMSDDECQAKSPPNLILGLLAFWVQTNADLIKSATVLGWQRGSGQKLAIERTTSMHVRESALWRTIKEHRYSKQNIFRKPNEASHTVQDSTRNVVYL